MPVTLNGAIVFYLCSTSNHNPLLTRFSLPALSFTFVLHQTTTAKACKRLSYYCLLPLFYIKPQRVLQPASSASIVFYLCSTSNHNLAPALPTGTGIVFYLCSTSNHNGWRGSEGVKTLSFTFVLHQTTTLGEFPFQVVELSFTFVLHQTTTYDEQGNFHSVLSFTFVLHQTTTLSIFHSLTISLSFTFVLHQTTTSQGCRESTSHCLLPLFYIKPQQRPLEQVGSQIVFYLCSTSNHNKSLVIPVRQKLSFTFVLHQTTTRYFCASFCDRLSFTFVLHQTTTVSPSAARRR